MEYTELTEGPFIQIKNIENSPTVFRILPLTVLKSQTSLAFQRTCSKKKHPVTFYQWQVAKQ